MLFGWTMNGQANMSNLCQSSVATDERTRSHKGKLKVIGCIAGQVIEMIYALLKKDAETLSKVPPGETPPEPMLYDREIHQAHRQGKYRSLKPADRRERIVLLPKQ